MIVLHVILSVSEESLKKKDNAYDIRRKTGVAEGPT